MKHTILVSFALFGVMLGPIEAKSGTEIPQPAQAIAVAVEQAMVLLRGEYLDPAQKVPTAIPTEVQYTNVYCRNPEKPSASVKLEEWCWVITLTHPIQNDHSWTFKVGRDGKVTLLGSTI